MTEQAKSSVIMVCSQMPPVYGGAGAQAALLGRTLANRGWDVTAITLDQMGVGSSDDRGVRFRRTLRGVAPTSIWSRIVTTVALGVSAFAHIVSKRPSVVHIHGAYWWSLLPAIAGRLVDARIVVKLTRDGEDDARSVNSKRLGPLPVGKLYGLSLRLADAVIVLNEHARQIAVSEGLGDRTHLIFNGVDEARLGRSPSRRAAARAAHGLGDDDRVVLFVGYLVKHKGIIDLIDAWRDMGDRSARLWLVGPFEGFYHNREEGREVEIPRLIDGLVRDGFQVTKFGHVPGDDLPQLYWAADVFVLPSYVEGMPNSLAEALVAGCQVVATRIPGITEIMGTDNCDLVSPGDVLALAERLKRAVQAPKPPPANFADRLAMSELGVTYERLYRERRQGTLT